MGLCQRRAPGTATTHPITLGGLLLTVASLSLTQAALADDLPAQLLAAGKLVPATESGRERCSAIAGLENQLRFNFAIGDHQTSADGGAGYTRDAKGAYLGDGPTGAPAPPFVQALLDAGAAQRVTLTWAQRTTTPTGRKPHLQDLGAPASQGSDAPAFVTRQATLQGDAFLVTGEDRTFFIPSTNQYDMAPRPPAIADQDAGANGHPASSQPSPPPGVWSTAKLCVSETAQRVLEYSDVRTGEDGVKYVSAAIVFSPERMPAWASDFRVTAATRNVFLPQDVHFVSFRNDGDGWRPVPYPDVFAMLGATHIVDAE